MHTNPHHTLRQACALTHACTCNYNNSVSLCCTLAGFCSGANVFCTCKSAPARHALLMPCSCILHIWVYTDIPDIVLLMHGHACAADQEQEAEAEKATVAKRRQKQLRKEQEQVRGSTLRRRACAKCKGDGCSWRRVCVFVCVHARARVCSCACACMCVFPLPDKVKFCLAGAVLNSPPPNQQPQLTVALWAPQWHDR